MRDAKLLPKGYQQLTSAGAVLTPTVPSGASWALIKTETKAVRWRDDGTNPDGSTGMLLDVGDEFWYTGALNKLRLIEDGATSTAKVSIAYYA
jgi:hypothetical protein